MSADQRRAISANRREIILGGALVATAGLSWAMTPRRKVVALPDGDITDAVPTRVASWQPAEDADVVLPPPDERQAANVYDDQVLRAYENNDNSPIMLVIAYDRSQSGMLMVHRPESCYPGSGFTITKDVPVAITLAQGLVARGRFLSTQRDTRIEQVLYWTRLGNEFPQTWDEERRFLALQNLRGLRPDGALIRLSTIDSDEGAAYLRLMRFANAIYLASDHRGRALLGGPASVSAERA